jgi:uncharacterized protein YbaR (Trm112 family)
MEAGVDAELLAVLDILACPDTHHAPLRYDEAAQTLTCTECGRVFPITDGVPELVLDRALGPDNKPDERA